MNIGFNVKKFKDFKSLVNALSLVLFALCLLVPNCQAKDFEFNVSLSNEKTSPGRKATVFLTFYDITQMPLPNMPLIEGLDFNYVGTSSKKLEHYGKTVDTVIHAYNVVATKPGHFWIGPFTFSYKGDSFSSNDVLLRVESGAAPVYPGETVQDPETTAVSEIEEMNIEKRIFIELDVPRTEVYTNERVPITVKFYSDWLDVEDVQIWDAPNDHFVTNKYETGKTGVINRGNIKFVLVEFNKTIFAPEKGEFDFGPVLASCKIGKKTANLLNFNEKFYDDYLGKSTHEKLDLKIEPIKITVLPLPLPGRPADFRGSIGQFSLEAKIDNNKVDLGSPLSIVSTITGKGNINSITAPVLENSEGITTYDPVPEIHNDGMTYTQLIKITSPGIKAVPEIIFSYFDTEKKSYITLRNGPFPVSVITPDNYENQDDIKQKPAGDGVEEKQVNKGLVAIKKRLGKTYYNPPRLYLNKVFLIFQLIPILALFFSIMIQKRIHKLKTDRAYAGWIKASKMAKSDIEKLRYLLRNGEPEAYYLKVFKTLQNYIGTRLDLDPGGISVDTVDKLLAPKLDDKNISTKLKKIFNDCYDIRYARSEKAEVDPNKMFESLEEVVASLNGKEKI